MAGNELPKVPIPPPSTASDLQNQKQSQYWPLHPYKGQERNMAGNKDVEGFCNNPGVMKGREQCKPSEEKHTLTWTRGLKTIPNWQIHRDFHRIIES